MTDEQVYAGVEKALRKYFGKRGERVVKDNLNCVKRGYQELQRGPRERSSRQTEPASVLTRFGTYKMHGGVPRPSSMNEAESSRSVQQQFLRHAWSTRTTSESSLPILDVDDFNDRIIRAYEDGTAEKGLAADLAVARSLVPAGTASLRDFSYVAPEIPEYIADNCTGCMDCVTLCPDTAILGKVLASRRPRATAGGIPGPGGS